MKIKKLTVEGLNDKHDFTLDFHDDLNILTGRNGSGKTTILKLLWFAISGNCELLEDEIRVAYAEIHTTDYILTFRRGRTDKSSQFAFIQGDKRYEFTEPQFVVAPDQGFQLYYDYIVESRHRPTRQAADQLNSAVLSVKASSLFFPTFRRIEGGFSIGNNRRNELDGAMSRLASQLTNKQHRFVASISTDDIVQMLTRQYANISEQINEDHKKLSADINRLIATARQDPQQTLESVQQSLNQHSAQQENLLRPFSSLSDMVATIFRHKGILLTPRLALGDATSAISSAALSAGEKQMLSFLAYNAFETDGSIFIDEPEISLHVDWQRRLFPSLVEQKTNNQFIIATHSPFIYSKYADKELQLALDRGDMEPA